jgi:hypothetical protein
MGANKELIEKINNFREEREWKKFHNSRDFALSLFLEAKKIKGRCLTFNGQE